MSRRLAVGEGAVPVNSRYMVLVRRESDLIAISDKKLNDRLKPKHHLCVSLVSTLFEFELDISVH